MDNFSRTSFDTKQLKNLQILTITTNLTIEKINRKQRTANIVLAIGGLNGFVSTEVQNSTFVLRLKFSAKTPAHRQYVARWATCKKRRQNIERS
jgi:hypothetical protein